MVYTEMIAMMVDAEGVDVSLPPAGVSEDLLLLCTDIREWIEQRHG